MQCPKCGKPYISRSVFSTDPPIDVVIHKQKRKHIKKLHWYVNEATDICYVKGVVL